MGTARSRGQGWPEATPEGLALMLARTVPSWRIEPAVLMLPIAFEVQLPT